MHNLPPLLGLLFVATITPGPNNLVVLRAASRGGLHGALPAIGGIVLGGLLLLTVTALGASAAFDTLPSLRRWLGMAGAAYLFWLGISLGAAGMRRPLPGDASTDPVLPSGTAGLIGFQLLNPKGWVMVVTALAVLPPTAVHDYLLLAGLFVLIPVPCLLLWAWLGARLSSALMRPAIRRGIDVGMGALLTACAGLLLIEP